jgi:hypothetical protein
VEEDTEEVELVVGATAAEASEVDMDGVEEADMVSAKYNLDFFGDKQTDYQFY